MNENSTTISYDQVRNDANTIINCAKTMQNIFDSFGSSMRRVGAEDVFVGDAKETLGERFNSLQKKFDNYVQLVNEFSSMIQEAATSTEQTEKGLTSSANQLAG